MSYDLHSFKALIKLCGGIVSFSRETARQGRGYWAPRIRRGSNLEMPLLDMWVQAVQPAKKYQDERKGYARRTI